MTVMLANYEVPREAFASLLTGDCLRRILLVQGDSGTGKTALLTYCRSKVPDTDFHVVLVQLRGVMVSVAEIFSRIHRVLGWAALPRLTKHLASLEAGLNIKIEGNQQEGFNNRINLVLHTGDNKDDRDQRRIALTDACFEDLANLGKRMLMVFDTFEQANSEVAAWLEGPFLTRVEQTATLRVMIAGQKVPNRNNIEWGHCCDHHDLPGVPEAPHWLPVLQNMGRHVPNRNPEDWLAGVCAAFNGRPDSIMKVIEALPRQGGAA